MVTVLLVIVVVGLGIALYEVASSRRATKRDTRSQLEALSRVVEPQRRDRHRHPGPAGEATEERPDEVSDGPSPPDRD